MGCLGWVRRGTLRVAPRRPRPPAAAPVLSEQAAVKRHAATTDGVAQTDTAGSLTMRLCTQTTRVLAEEQFMKRALTEKILAGIPMREFGLSMRPAWS